METVLERNPELEAERTERDDPETSLRPLRLEDFTGQQPVRENLRVFIDSASSRGEAKKPNRL